MSQRVLETVKEAMIQAGTSSALGADTLVGGGSVPGAGALGGWEAECRGAIVTSRSQDQQCHCDVTLAGSATIVMSRCACGWM